MAWKDGQTEEEVLEAVLRSYLIRCHRTIALDYPEIADMAPENAADYLLHLRRTKRINVKLRNGADGLIHCRITNVDGSGAAMPSEGKGRETE